jgi:hypothetical protein
MGHGAVGDGAPGMGMVSPNCRSYFGANWHHFLFPEESIYTKPQSEAVAL